MTFFSRETSKPLQERGCVFSGDYWWIDGNLVLCEPGKGVLCNDVRSAQHAGHPYDLLGGNEQAMENCKKLWPGNKEEYCSACWRPHDHQSDCDMGCGNDWTPSQYHRHALLDLPDSEKEAYVIKTLEKK